MHDRRFSRGRRAHALRCGHDDRCRRFPPDRDVGAGIAGVDETFRAEALDQRCGFRCPTEVVVTVRRNHFIEKAEMIGDLLRNSTVCRRGQHQHAALRLLLLQVSEEFAVIGKVGRIEIPASRQFFLKPRLALSEPARQRQHDTRIGHAGGDGRFVQRIGRQQRAIEIDA